MAARRKVLIQDPDNLYAVQTSLFLPPGVTQAKPGLNPFPTVEVSPTSVREAIELIDGDPGLDFEFNETKAGVYRPTITGLAYGDRKIAASRFDADTLRLLVDYVMTTGKKLVCYSVIGAEKKVIKDSLGIDIPLEFLDDAMLRHYLMNQDFCKAPSKTEDDDSGALGFMNLYTAATMTVDDCSQWKECRGKACEGPCPRHLVFDYCGVDSWVGRHANKVYKEQMKQWQVPEQLYRELLEISYVAEEMQQKGIYVNREYVKGLEEGFKPEQLAKMDTSKLSATDLSKLVRGFEGLKDDLFPQEDNQFEHFNPKSSEQVIAWFQGRGITLESNDRKDVHKALEKTAERYGFPRLEDLGAAEELPLQLDMLYRLDQYKAAGKGLKPWFADKYFGLDGNVHARFIVTGTSTGRLSSSRPNFQNIPARGFGDWVRRCVEPRHKDLDLLKADFSQLELRMCLYLAEVDPEIIGADAFLYLVDSTGDLMYKAAEMMDPGKYKKDPRKAARNIAKSISHAGDYLEGFRVLYGSDLMKPSVKRDIAHGALKVYHKKYMPHLSRNWEYRGGVVAFTGANLAERLFGDRSLENRKKALSIQEDIYFAKFPMLRTWHQKVLSEIESRGYVRSPVGRFLRLYGTPEDDAKMATAFLGQGVSADHVQGVMLRFFRELKAIPVLQVHDELVFEIPREWSNERANQFMSLMTEPTWRLSNFKASCETKRGRNWLDMSTIHKGFYGAN
jgi:DNA polymerase I-like protein with 3'-5' exonuclease and polymerase domains